MSRSHLHFLFVPGLTALVSCAEAASDAEHTGRDNVPPGAPQVELTPEAPTDQDDLLCAVTTPSSDPEGDEITYEVSWLVDGSPWAGPVTTTVLPGDTVSGRDTSVGETWSCVVTPHDGTEPGEPASDAATILGSRCLVGHWAFDEGTGSTAADGSVSGNDGELMGDAAWTTGAVGAAVRLDGDGDYVTMGDILNAVSLPVTVAAWVWVDGTDYFRIVNTDDDDDIYSGIYFAVAPTNELLAGFGDGTGGGGYQWRQGVTSKSSVTRGNWTHVAVVIRGQDDMDLFVDGSPVPGDYDGDGGPMATGSYPFHVGKTLGASSESSGAIDELRVYDCGLRHTEVAALAAR